VSCYDVFAGGKPGTASPYLVLREHCLPGVPNSDRHVYIHHPLGLPGSVAIPIPWTAS